MKHIHPSHQLFVYAKGIFSAYYIINVKHLKKKIKGKDSEQNVYSKSHTVVNQQIRNIFFLTNVN